MRKWLCLLLVLLWMPTAACFRFSEPPESKSAVSNTPMAGAPGVEIRGAEHPETEAPRIDASYAEPDYGFASEEHLRGHYAKHGAEFGVISQDEYLARAKALRDAPVGGPILQIIRADEVRTRFDQRNGDFIAFGQDLTILTFFRPGDGERYFYRQASRPR